MVEATTPSSTPPAPGTLPAAVVPPAAVTSSPTPPSPTSSASTAQTRPDYVPESYWDAATGIKHKEFGEHYTGLATRLAADEVRRNALPKTAADVKVELPKEFKLPEGMKWEFDTSAPEFGKFRDVAVKRGIDQDTVTELMGIFAEREVGSAATTAAAQKAEMDKLGANATARVTALDTFFTGILGAEDARWLRGGMYAAGIVTAMEKLVSKFSNQGHASFRQDGREPQGAPGRVSEEAYAKMSQAEKWDYARQFDQKQFQNGAR